VGRWSAICSIDCSEKTSSYTAGAVHARNIGHSTIVPTRPLLDQVVVSSPPLPAAVPPTAANSALAGRVTDVGEAGARYHPRTPLAVRLHCHWVKRSHEDYRRMCDKILLL